MSTFVLRTYSDAQVEELSDLIEDLHECNREYPAELTATVITHLEGELNRIEQVWKTGNPVTDIPTIQSLEELQPLAA